MFVRECPVSEVNLWMGIILLVFILMILSFAIIQILSKLLSKREWEEWVKTEAHQLVISVVIVFMAWSFSQMACDAGVLLIQNVKADLPTYAQGKGVFEIADSYLNRIGEDAKTMYIWSVFQSWWIEAHSSLTLQFGPTVWGWRFTPSAGAETIADVMSTLRIVFVPLIASIFVQRIVLSIAHQISFEILLPIGIMLRVVPPLRKAGSFLIALAFAFYIVFPLTYVLSALVWKDISEFNISTWDRTVEIANKIAIIPSAVSMPFFLPFELLNTSFIDLVKLVRHIAYLSPQALFLPALSMIITLTAVRAFANMLNSTFG